MLQRSFIMSKDVLLKHGLNNRDSIICVEKQWHALCNLPDNDNLRAALRSKTTALVPIAISMWPFVSYSTTGNAQAASVLLEGGRSEAHIEQLEDSLRKGFVAIAALLQQEERAKKDIKMCDTCSINIGCCRCTNLDNCVSEEEQKHCRQRALADNRFCKVCNECLCPDCHVQGRFASCEKCNGIECRFPGCGGKALSEHARCSRKKHRACVEEDGEGWADTDCDMADDMIRCPACMARPGGAQSASSSNKEEEEEEEQALAPR